MVFLVLVSKAYVVCSEAYPEAVFVALGAVFAAYPEVVSEAYPEVVFAALGEGSEAYPEAVSEASLGEPSAPCPEAV